MKKGRREMEKHEAPKASPTLVMMPFDDPEEEKAWDALADQINERTRNLLSRAH